MPRVPPLKAVQAFEAAARLSSFLRAAEELLITPSAVSHRIRQLEHELGIKLFHRMHRSIVLTDVGRRYAEDIAEALGRIEAATRNVAGTEKSDIVTIHVVPSLATQWLMPRLARFSALNPHIDVRLNASHERVDLATGVVDFDIGYGTTLLAPGATTEYCPKEQIVVLCSPALANGVHPIRKPADLQRHTLIHSEVNLYAWRDWMKDHPEVRLDLERGPRFDRSFMAIGAAIDGLGVCMESRILVERELAIGHLVMPFGPVGPRIQCHYLSYLKSRARLPKMEMFRAWLLDELRKSASVATGEE